MLLKSAAVASFARPPAAAMPWQMPVIAAWNRALRLQELGVHLVDEDRDSRLGQHEIAPGSCTITSGSHLTVPKAATAWSFSGALTVNEEHCRCKHVGIAGTACPRPQLLRVLFICSGFERVRCVSPLCDKGT